MKKHTRLIAAFLALVTLFGLFAGFAQPAQAAETTSVSAIKKRGTIKIAVFGDLPPYVGSTKMVSAKVMILP